MAQTNVQAFSGDVEIAGGITQGNQVLYPQKRWEIDLTSGTTTDRFYPTYLASSSPSDVGRLWPINFKVFGESLTGSDPYNEETLIGYARGGGYSDHSAMCKVHSTRYGVSDIRFQGLWEGTSSSQNGFVIYMRGGYKYSILTDASTVVENKNIFVVDGSTYALKNSAGVDAYGTSVDISQVMNVTDFVQTGQVTATTGSLILPESTARLGIRTNNPGVALDVVGDVAISSNLAVDTNTLFVDSVGNKVGIGTTNPGTALDVVGTVTATTFSGKTVGTHYGTISGSNAAAVSSLTASGNVGIGTASPGYKLHIEQGGGVNGNGIFISNSNYGSMQGVNISMINTGAYNYSSYASIQPYSSGVAGATNLALCPTGGKLGIGKTNPGSALDVVGDVAISSNLAVDTNTLFVDSVGNKVGIGTANPHRLLDVSDSTAETAMHISGLASQSNVFIYMTETSNRNAGAVLHYSGRGTPQGFRVGHLENSTTPRYDFAIDRTSGNVGIGTASPSGKLHVNGNAIIGDVGGYGGVSHTDAQLTLGGDS